MKINIHIECQKNIITKRKIKTYIKNAWEQKCYKGICERKKSVAVEMLKKCLRSESNNHV